MNSKFLTPKKHGKAGTAFIVFSAIGVTSALIALHLCKQRHNLCKEIKTPTNPPHPHTSTVSAGCQHVGQNKATPAEPTFDATSSEWERGIS